MIRICRALVIALLAAAAADAQDCVNYDNFLTSRGVVDDLNGAASVALWNDTACVADEDFGLYMVDVADPDAPSLAASLRVGDGERGQGYDVAVQGDVAYLAAGYYGVLAVDLPTRVVSPLPAVADSTWAAERLAVEGELACALIPEHASLVAYSLADPLAPAPIVATTVGAQPRDVVMADGLIYVATVLEGLLVYRFDEVLGFVRLGGSEVFHAVAVCVRDRWAYAAGYDGTVRIIDVANPAAPALVSEFTLPLATAPLEALAAGPGRLYLGYYRATGFNAVDVTDPADPRLLGSTSSYPFRVRGLAVRDGLAYVAGSFYLQVIDLAHQTSAPPRSQLIVGERLLDLVRSGDTLVGHGQDSNLLQLFDASDPDAVVAAGSLPVYFHHGLAVEGDIVVHSSGLNRVIDIGDIQQPVLLAEFAEERDHCTLDQGIAWFAGGTVYITAWDLRDPTDPQLLTTIEQFKHYSWLEAAAGLLFASNDHLELEIYDIADPAAPVLLSTTELEYYPSVGAVHDRMVCLAHSTVVAMLDASDPMAPVLYPGHRVTGSVHDLAFQGERVWFAADAGAVLLDVSDPGHLRQAGYVPVPDAPTLNVVTTDQAFFLSGGEHLWSGWPPCAEGVPVDDTPRARLLQLSAHPNPFNPRVTLRLALPSAVADAEVSVHDLAGRRLATLHRGPAAKVLELAWNGRDDRGRAVPAGVYLVRAISGAAGTSVKVALIK